MAKRWSLKTTDNIREFVNHIQDRHHRGESVTVEFVEHDRSTNQNSLFHQMLRVVAEQKGDETVDELKRFCKLRFGVPLLRAVDPSFCAIYDTAIKHSLTYEQKLEAMDLLPVTSRMDRATFSIFLDSVARFWTEQGYDLTEFKQL